jgi:hypothetical protein
MGLEVNADSTMHMVMSRDQNSGWSHSIMTDSSSFDRVEVFRYFGINIKYQNSIQEDIKSILNSVKACQRWVQNLLSSGSLFKNLNFKIYTNIFCLLFCMGVKMCRSYWWRKVGWESLIIWWWGEYLRIRGMR